MTSSSLVNPGGESGAWIPQGEGPVRSYPHRGRMNAPNPPCIPMRAPSHHPRPAWTPPHPPRPPRRERTKQWGVTSSQRRYGVECPRRAGGAWRSVGLSQSVVPVTWEVLGRPENGLPLCEIGWAISQIGQAICEIGWAISQIGQAICEIGWAISQIGLATPQIDPGMRRSGLRAPSHHPRPAWTPPHPPRPPRRERTKQWGVTSSQRRYGVECPRRAGGAWRSVGLPQSVVPVAWEVLGNTVCYNQMIRTTGQLILTTRSND